MLGPPEAAAADWLPAREFHHGPETNELHKEAGDTTAVSPFADQSWFRTKPLAGGVQIRMLALSPLYCACF